MLVYQRVPWFQGLNSLVRTFFHAGSDRNKFVGGSVRKCLAIFGWTHFVASWNDNCVYWLERNIYPVTTYSQPQKENARKPYNGTWFQEIQEIQIYWKWLVLVSKISIGGAWLDWPQKTSFHTSNPKTSLSDHDKPAFFVVSNMAMAQNYLPPKLGWFPTQHDHFRGPKEVFSIFEP
jgi:hypothetical protein